MTTRELAQLIAPQVRQALEQSKESILADMPAVRRTLVRTLWPLLVKAAVPVVTRINLEFLVHKYQRLVKPYVGPFVDGYIEAVKDSPDENLRAVRDYLTVLQTPSQEMLPSVQSVIAQETA